MAGLAGVDLEVGAVAGAGEGAADVVAAGAGVGVEAVADLVEGTGVLAAAGVTDSAEAALFERDVDFDLGFEEVAVEMSAAD